jgi:hypothetical protein
MSAIAFRIFLIVCLIVWIFLLPGLLSYLAGPHHSAKKVLQAISFFSSPIALPVGGLLVLSWWALVVVFGLLALILIYPFYWLQVRLSSGWLFKAWYNLSLRLLGWVRRHIELLLGLFLLPESHSESEKSPGLTFPIR